MSQLPSGTVTFLFTDIEGSTQLWEQHPDAMRSALAKHDSILKGAVESNHGQIIKTTGDGVNAVFVTAIDALHASIAAQHNFLKPLDEVQINVRMGLHTGEAELRDGDYYGGTLNRAARIMSAGNGGQILLSEVTAQLAREQLPDGTSLLDMGEHHLKGLFLPERIFQLIVPDLPHEFPPLHSIPITLNNLPPQLTSFIGRERELAEAQKKLTSAKLLSLIGPGGTGKTRLALRIAREQIANFRDGVWLVELAPISDPAFIIPAIASVFELREIQNIPLIEILLDYLRAKEMLLMLDNCEHLIEASAQITDQILHVCPNLKIIASSREALGIEGETVYRVPPLKDEEATRLFVERATKAEPRFHLMDENASFIAQICSRLDGIPLAIELAAARVKLFTPEQIAERLDDRFKLLTGGSRTALPRQQTLHALIDWSYQSLNEVEQRALRRLAVFSGGWTFEAAEAVIGEDVVMDGLLGLVNKSMVNVEEQEGASRYRFLETIRQYAMEKLLESGEAVESRDRQLDYFMKLGEGASVGLFTAEVNEYLDIFEIEHDNLRSALKWAATSHPEKALKLVDHMGSYWSVRDHNSEAINWCQMILEKTESIAGLEMDRARAQIVLGWCCITTGEHRLGRMAAEQALALSNNTNDESTIARAYGILALACVFTGDFPAAQHAAEEGEMFARTRGLKSELAFILASRAQIAYVSNGDVPKAKEYMDEAARLSREMGFQWSYSFSTFGLARIAAELGDMELARKRFAESEEVARQMGNKRIIYSSRSELAHVLRQHGEIDEALKTYLDLLPKWKELGHRSAVAHELECIAFILVKKGNPARAASLLGAAEALRKAIDSVMTPIEQEEFVKELKSLRASMNDEELQQSWENGRRLSMDESIAFALEAANG